MVSPALDICRSCCMARMSACSRAAVSALRSLGNRGVAPRKPTRERLTRGGRASRPRRRARCSERVPHAPRAPARWPRILDEQLALARQLVTAANARYSGGHRHAAGRASRRDRGRCASRAPLLAIRSGGRWLRRPCSTPASRARRTRRCRRSTGQPRRRAPARVGDVRRRALHGRPELAAGRAEIQPGASRGLGDGVDVLADGDGAARAPPTR